MITLWIASTLLLGQSDPATEAGGRIDEILSKLEARSDGLEDIRTSVVLVDDDQVNLSKNEKRGRILFWMTEPNPHFLIHFQKTSVDGIVGKQEWYLFDGQWLQQAVERTRHLTRQEIAQPGEKVDMFDLERTPFPLPFGQKKDQMLRNFDVNLLPSSAGDPPDTDHLVLTPKSTSRMYRKYDRIDMYVNRTVHLPTRIVVIKNQGREVATADFPDLSTSSINTGVGKGDFSPPGEWKGYKQVIEELVPTDEAHRP